MLLSNIKTRMTAALGLGAQPMNRPELFVQSPIIREVISLTDDYTREYHNTNCPVFRKLGFSLLASAETVKLGILSKM